MSASRTRNLGSYLAELLETLDDAVEAAYRADGLDYRPRYTPVMRVLGEHGPSSVTQIARRAPLSHSAASQTVAHMVRAGLVESRPGRDARERVVSLTPRGEEILPALRRHWAATARALATISADVGVSLEDVLDRALEALKSRPFEARVAEAQVDLGAAEPAQ